MFTGIIEEVGTIRDIKPDRLTINSSTIISDIKIGDSVAVNGACLTVIATGDRTFSVDLMPETQKKTAFKYLRTGDKVNMERAILAGGRLGGHFVQGHVDGTGRVISLIPEGNASIMKVGISQEISKYVVIKGFIAVEGVSLTVIACDSRSFSVSLVSYSRDNTTLGYKKPGAEVNIEVDILAKYIEKFINKQGDQIILDFMEGYDAPAKGRI